MFGRSIQLGTLHFFIVSEQVQHCNELDQPNVRADDASCTLADLVNDKKLWVKQAVRCLEGDEERFFLQSAVYFDHVQQESTTTMQLPMTLRDNAATVHNQSKLAASLTNHDILSECVFGRLSLVNEHLSAAAYIIHCYCAHSPPRYACNL